ncbi:MAG: sulfite exporter TauE/SafE family protein [Saprospiraceae bacterium]|nr:sulfite exporter TauE/SafE family protein [Candidatus Opimibacter iunctus]
MEKLKFKHITFVILALKLIFIVWLFYEFFHSNQQQTFTIDQEFLLFCLAGFIAQIIDGTLGMAYGVSCSTILLQLGISPAVASASVHTAEVFTTGVSGLSHLYFKNVDKNLFIRLAIPGIIGAVIGAFLLSKVLDGNVVKPFIAGYLLVLGILILIKSIREPLFKDEIKRVSPLGFIGGLLDAIGGGGWGPVVTSNIIHRGKTPQMTIGTVNTAEFFVAFFSTGVFLFFLGLEGWKIILGLIFGGVLAAPVGPYLIKFLRPRVLMFIVGIFIIITSCYTIYLSLR